VICATLTCYNASASKNNCSPRFLLPRVLDTDECQLLTTPINLTETESIYDYVCSGMRLLGYLAKNKTIADE